MIDTLSFYTKLCKAGVGLFAGVPDSLLSSLSACLMEHAPQNSHIITANEGNAVALAAGYHLGTGGLGAVYLQNSGLGNTVNPLVSLTDAEVYRIPLLLIIGWRGEPGVKDEPQHVKQGRITLGQLDLLEIPYQIVDSDSDIDAVIQKTMEDIQKTGAPVALVVKKNAFTPYSFTGSAERRATLSREEALEGLLELSGDALIVSTTGKTSREVYELRVARQEEQRDFLTVGAMGHTASIALGVALGKPDKRVVCLDGDGSLLMHLGALPIIASLSPTNLVHVLLNNASHESVGGQPTICGQIDFEAISKGSGYKHYFRADSPETLQMAWQAIEGTDGPILLEVIITASSRTDLGRPSSTPEENKQAFVKAVNR
ncbi:phosphonopyruvate decarboxylase [Orrella sp. 11846]|uniref:phosphonopyruvate decarboxylase n=1 Tax=Orrella sp. 11846 TaxID=3409913 RepID=UPI003B5B5CB3